MKKRIAIIALLAGLAVILVPSVTQAQHIGDGISEHVNGMHGILSGLYKEMLPLCSRLINVSRAIAGFAALWDIASKVWPNFARAEPIDFYPILRPGALGIAILLFPSVLGVMNGILKPVSEATAAMAKDSNYAIQYYVDQREQQVTEQPQTMTQSGDPNEWTQYEQPDDSGQSSGFLSGVASWFHVKDMFMSFLRQVLEVLYTAAGLAIDTIRTFYMIILSIIGPLVFGLSVFESFRHTLSHWISRYVHVYMWLPVSNIFGAISSTILQLLIEHFGLNFNTPAYLVFMVLCIIGYTTVPSVAGYIIQPGGGSKDTLLHKANKILPSFKKNR